jgi:hypothetical protein
MRLSSQFFGAIVQSRVRRKFTFPDFELLAHGDKIGGTRAGDEGGEWLPAVVFIQSFLFCAGDKHAFVLLNASGVSNGLLFCELCENVNNFCKKFLPATAIHEKTLLSSTLTGSRTRRKIVPILPAA